jgi:hypothetical protein
MMLPICLFFVLFTGTPEETKMDECQPFIDFVSHCRNDKLIDRMNEYRAKIDILKQKKSSRCKGNLDGIAGLMEEIARQGDFESLELLEKDLQPDLKKTAWNGAIHFGDTDEAKRLLAKWAKENPTEPLLFKYQPNGVQLMIKMAEDRNAPFSDRVTCLQGLANMRVTTDVLDRIRALTSDKSHSFYLPNNAPEDLTLLPTVGSIAADIVKIIEQRKLQEK